ncbi:no significant blast hit [Histoplasma capsulatum G186AR]|uniref:Uncharacterized protein n=1 Tax=Ajellomyces capsulatus TaxID=5037 RepID=A0A8H7Z792_AJECA|nr:hypothetical protein I7I52_00136 [Histoplasma capsulatum]QSS72128.1 no significant blast hit [Histoplasma capsulatum G186AR]
MQGIQFITYVFKPFTFDVFNSAWSCSQLHAHHIILIIIIIDTAPAYWQETSYIYIYMISPIPPGRGTTFIISTFHTPPPTHSPTHYSLTFPPSHIVGSPWPRGAPSQSHSTEQNKTRKKKKKRKNDTQKQKPLI